MGQQNIPIRVEPGIFEWLGWYQLGLPRFFTPTELKGQGYNVDINYQPVITTAKFDMEEDIQDYYKRSGETSKRILAKHQQEGTDKTNIIL
jgi:ubiquitin-associated SH3 domain-containing protein